MVVTDLQQEAKSVGSVGKIPVRNLWLLMLYASQLFRHLGQNKVSVEENPDDIPDLVAEILAYLVERRLKRNLSFGYRQQTAVLNRVRGRIDMLKTERHQLLTRGRIACRFDDMTVNTPRNRFVRAALVSIAAMVHRSELAGRCRSLARSLKEAGVVGERPTRSEMSVDRLGRHDADDKMMLEAAQLAFDLALPTEVAGNKSLLAPDREMHWLRKLYEKAVAGFYEVVLAGSGWHVHAGQVIKWQVSEMSSGMNAILPQMLTDIVLENLSDGRRMVIDTKFNEIIASGSEWHHDTIRSGYLYQMYAYLRTQERDNAPLSLNTSGLLLHPTVCETIDEYMLTQGHSIRFATVDLAAAATAIRARLLELVG